MKKLFVASLMLLVAVTGFAFNKKHHPKSPVKPVITSWYQFTGSVSSLTEVQDPTKYTYLSTPLSCTTGSAICQIQVPGATGTGAHPSAFTATNLSDLSTAFNGGTPQPYIRMKD